MNCLSFRQNASLYVDRQLDGEANQEFLFHLNSCRECFQYVDEIRQTAQLLQQLGPALPPPQLAGEILANLNAARACQNAPRSFVSMLHNFIFYSRPQYISYAAGFIITCMLFAGIIYGFRPQFRTQITDTFVSVVTPPTPAISIPLPTVNETLPSVQSSTAFADITVQAYQQIPTKDLFVVAD